VIISSRIKMGGVFGAYRGEVECIQRLVGDLRERVGGWENN
jgi:hypothetical protein